MAGNSKFTLLDFDRVIAQLRRRLRLVELRPSNTLNTGLAADRPTAPTTNEGTTVSFYATNTKTLSIWNTVTNDWDEVVLS